LSQPSFSRRGFLARTGAVAAGAIAGSSVLSRAAAADEPVGTLIVGSGYAGAVAAYRLAEAGRSAVVLERGRRWPIKPDGTTFATMRDLDGRASWLSTALPVERYTGVLELYSGNGIAAYGGAGVGGGSLVNNGITMQPPRALFRRSFGELLPWHEMDTVWYPRARKLLGAAPIPDDVLNSAPYLSARAFRDECANAGLRAVKPDVLIDWDVVRRELAGTAVPSTILGDSALGINSGAKLSLDRGILGRAEASGRISVLTHHQARDITRSGSRYLVTCELLDDQGNVTGTRRFAAREVFLAAGSVHTTRLLVRAKAKGDLPALNQHVGRWWGNGGDAEYVRAGMPFEPTTGGPAELAALDWNNPHNPVTLLAFPAAPSPIPGVGITGALATQVCPPAGYFAYDAASDSVGLTWPTADPEVAKLDLAVHSSIDRLNAANPGTSLYWYGNTHTSHPLGGAVLGRACDPFGQVRGHPGLYVVDSALIPGSTGAVPPSLTVTALADRCVTAAIRGR
jgi:cholesterol oxidase